MKQISKYAFFIALIALVWIPVQASAQLTLDNFTSGAYVKRIINPNVQDLHYAALPPKRSFRSGSSNIFWGGTESGWAMEHS